MKKIALELGDAQMLTKDQMKMIAGGCDVTCGSGYYACCGSLYGCHCKMNSQEFADPDCSSAGGPGATQCAI